MLSLESFRLIIPPIATLILLIDCMQDDSNLTINLDSIRKLKEKSQQGLLTESPITAAVKKRKSKIYTNRKTNEELILESHEDLMRYVDTVDERVQAIIQTYEKEFLGAYRLHIKKVREEMEEIRRRSLNNASSEKMHLDKIDALEKEIVVFRDESLKLFERLIRKDKEIETINIKMKELANENKDYEKKIYQLTKRNKELEVFAETARLKNAETSRESRTQNMHRVIATPASNRLSFDQDMPRPCTTGIHSKSNSLTLKIQSMKKNDSQNEYNWLKEKLEEKMGNTNVVNIDTVFKLLSERGQRLPEGKTMFEQSKRGKSSYYSKIEKKRSSFRIMEHDLTRLKSRQLNEKNELEEIFKNCVDQIRKDIIRRNNIPSLNYFKENGPKNFIEFKKTDHYALVQLLFTNEPMLRRIYQLIFSEAK